MKLRYPDTVAAAVRLAWALGAMWGERKIPHSLQLVGVTAAIAFCLAAYLIYSFAWSSKFWAVESAPVGELLSFGLLAASSVAVYLALLLASSRVAAGVSIVYLLALLFACLWASGLLSFTSNAWPQIRTDAYFLSAHKFSLSVVAWLALLLVGAARLTIRSSGPLR